MKQLKFILPLVILLAVTSCEKVKLEEDEKGKLLIGKWKYEKYGYSTDSESFVSYQEPPVLYEIEFLEGGKVCINDNGETNTYRIRKFSEIEPVNLYSEWRAGIYYGKEKENLSIDVRYYSENEIRIEQLPVLRYEPGPYVGQNVFKRIE